MSSIQVYFSDKDILIVPLAKRNEFCAMGGIEPGKKHTLPIDPEDLGKELITASEISDHSTAIAMKDIVWVEGKLAGIKSPRVFSRKYRNISIEKSDYYTITEMKQNPNGEYLGSEDTPAVTLPLAANAKELGQAVLDYFDMHKKCNNDNMRSFSLLSGGKLEYRAPSSGFLDVGDAHTDAYQVYIFEEAQDCYIGFIFADFYKEISRKGIENKWKSSYKIDGPVMFRKAEGGFFLYEASYDDALWAIQSKFFLEDSHWQEWAMFIDKSKCGEDTISQIKSEYNEIAKSCRIIPD